MTDTGFRQIIQWPQDGIVLQLRRDNLHPTFQNATQQQIQTVGTVERERHIAG